MSGIRVCTGTNGVKKTIVKSIDGKDHDFINYGAHCDNLPADNLPYFTAAAAIGQTTEEIDIFIKRLDNAFDHFY